MNRKTDNSEIEITPEMIAAGRAAIERRWMDFTGISGYRLWDEVLRATFLAMSEAKSKSRA